MLVTLTGLRQVVIGSVDNLQALLHEHRIGYLATADTAGIPHVIPVCFVYDGQAVYSAIDHKPKRVTDYRMKRIRNILENPQVAFLIERYHEDWQQLYYVLMRGTATLLASGPEYQNSLKLLETKYRQYQERELTKRAGLVIKIRPESIRHWEGGHLLQAEE